jgi:hypothetical protein
MRWGRRRRAVGRECLNLLWTPEVHGGLGCIMATSGDYPRHHCHVGRRHTCPRPRMGGVASELPPARVEGGPRTCCVCNAPLAAPVRGTATYRKTLAALRAGVCAAHLAGDHVVGGVLSRFCSNHRTWHSLDAYGVGKRSSTCAHARATSAARAKQQRALKRRTDVAEPGGAGQLRPRLTVPLLLPPLPDWGPGASSTLQSGSSDSLQSLLDLSAPEESSDLLLPLDGAGTGAGTGGGTGPESRGHGGAVGCTVSLVPSTLVPGVCTTAEATQEFLEMLAQSTGMQIVHCIAGVAAQAHSAQSEGSSGMYTLLCGVTPLLLEHNLGNLRNLQPTLDALVRQAQADERAGSTLVPAAPALAVLLDRLVASATKRADVLRCVRARWVDTGDMIVLFQEVLDGNEAHRHNMLLLTSLLQGAALCASPEDHARIVRLVAQWLQGQLSQLIGAVERRSAWMAALSPGTGLRGRVIKGVADLSARLMSMRQWWMTMVL